MASSLSLLSAVSEIAGLSQKHFGSPMIALSVHQSLVSSKDRFSFLVERQHPFPAVFGGDQAIVGFNLERQAIGQ
jgi:hypothetical protein